MGQVRQLGTRILMSVAQNYANAIIALSRNGLDRAVAAHTLCERFAVPAILYTIEAMVLSKGVLEKLDKIQPIVTRYILQLPKPSARVAGALDAGLMTMNNRVSIKLGNYVWEIQNKKDLILKLVFYAVMRSPFDKWAVQVEALKKAVGIHLFNGPKRCLQDTAMANVLDIKNDMSSLASA